jgi:hypothetical protein
LGRGEEAVDQLVRALDISPDVKKLLPGFREFTFLLQHPRLKSGES